ncbi:Protein of unknown function [Gryllus bimaculatus]|nr:Protein of unknown function [Gryllus bimaculatus]
MAHPGSSLVRASESPRPAVALQGAGLDETVRGSSMPVSQLVIRHTKSAGRVIRRAFGSAPSVLDPRKDSSRPTPCTGNGSSRSSPAAFSGSGCKETHRRPLTAERNAATRRRRRRPAAAAPATTATAPAAARRPPPPPPPPPPPRAPPRHPPPHRHANRHRHRTPRHRHRHRHAHRTPPDPPPPPPTASQPPPLLHHPPSSQPPPPPPPPPPLRLRLHHRRRRCDSRALVISAVKGAGNKCQRELENAAAAGLSKLSSPPRAALRGVGERG